MKRNKQWALLAITAIFALAFIGCGGDDNTEQPKDQSRQITFGDGLYTTVTGHMTDTQWTAVTAKLTTALDTVAAGDDGTAGNFAVLFAGIFNIDLVQTQDFNYYKVDGQASKFLLNVDFVISEPADEVSTKIGAAVDAVFQVGPLQE